MHVLRLGFVLFGIVLDKAYFFSFMLKLGSAAVTGITALLALRNDKIASELQECTTLTDAQAAVLKGFGKMNSMCTYNITVSSFGYTVHEPTA